MKMLTGVLVLSALTIGGTAAAGDREKNEQAFIDAAETVRNHSKDFSVDAKDADACKAAAAALKKAHKPGDFLQSDRFLDYSVVPKFVKADERYRIKVADIDAVCDRLEKIAGAKSHVEALRDLWMTGKIIEGRSVEIFDTEHLQMYEKEVAACHAAATAITATGVPEVALGNHGTMPPADIEPKICKPFDVLMDDFRKEVAKAEVEAKAEWEETAKPYKAVGIGGDKLEFVVKNESNALYGKGGKELKTPKEKAGASVMFKVLTGDSVTVQRFEFKGNTLATTGSKDYALRPGAAAFK